MLMRVVDVTDFATFRTDDVELFEREEGESEL